MLAASLLLALSPLALAGSPAFELSGTPSTWHSKYTMDTYHAQFLFDTLGQLSYRESMKFAGNVQFVYPNSSAYWITASDSNAVVFSKSIKSYLKDGGVEAILFSPPHEDGSGRSPFANQTLRESEDNESNFATERWM
jgi:hypothetical protein